MKEIMLADFKKKYLYFDSRKIGKNLAELINNDDRNIVIKNIFKIFPYMCEKDLQIILIYMSSTTIEYSNQIKIKLDKKLFEKYINGLTDEKITVDINRLLFGERFINYFDVKMRKNCGEAINLKNLDYIAEERINFYNIDEIENSSSFVEKILNLNKFVKYLFHQDIHNSIINPIINFIMIKNIIGKNRNKNILIQLMEIKQIYKDISNNGSSIELLYLADKVMIFNYQNEISETPKKYLILPGLIIKCQIKIFDNHLVISLTY